MSHIGLRILAVFYFGGKVQCTVCDHTYRQFLPYGRVSRSNALCPKCLALERHRLIWLYLQKKTNFFDGDLDVLHIAPELCFIRRFEILHGDRYITADLESPLAKVKLDVHDMPFQDNTFNVAFCNHVMEHVSDDVKAMKEIYRVLKPGGWAIIQIPLFYPLQDKTFEDFSITDPREREKVFGQDDHVRLYGKDYIDRLRLGGFDAMEDDFVKSLSKEQIKRHALPAEEPIFLCKKV